jgi:hypothetical protein
VKAAGVLMFVVPIQPKYHARLFPDVDPPGGLCPGEPLTATASESVSLFTRHCGS